MTVDELLARFPEVPRDLRDEPVLARYVDAFGPVLRHAVKPSPWGSLANVQSIHREGGHWRGVTEPRGYGLAKGY